MILLERFSPEERQTIGNLYLLEDNGSMIDSWFSLELPWLDNQKYISCIPIGNYTCFKHVSPKFGPCLWIKEVNGRSEVLIHPANYYTQLLGCIAIGKDLKHINTGKDIDVAQSRKAMAELLNQIEGDEIHLRIVNK
jgi:hypothetical protein